MAIAECGRRADEQSRELRRHGTAAFPLACYHDDLGQAAVPWHWHDEWEAVVVERGESVVSTGTEELVVREGEGFFLNAGVLHTCSDMRPEKECLYRSLVFSPALIGGAPDSIFWERYVLPVLRNPTLRLYKFAPDLEWERGAIDCIDRAWAACAEEADAYEITARSELSRLIALLAAHVDQPLQSVPAADIRNETRVKRMLEYIQEHFSENISVRSIAASAAISESECLRCFKRMLGTTPVRYLISYRLEKAEALLTTADLRITEIGERCGFREMSYFAKLFQARYGSPPKEFRAMHAARDAGERGK